MLKAITATSSSSNSRRGRARLALPVVMLLSVGLLLLLWPSSYSTAGAVAQPASQQQTAAGTSSARVPVTLYVMSKCPDARFCQTAFKPVLETLPSLIDLRTQYIAKPGREGDVSCMHGAKECEGNKQQLCLRAALAPADSQRFLAALICHGAAGGDVTDAKRLQSCMADAGIGADAQAKALQCVSGTQGAALAAESAKDVEANGVKKSCTVFIDGAKKCIRDGGRWYDCEGGSEAHSFIKQICAAHAAKSGGAVAPECKAALAL